jgi:hypothetical protein
MAETVKRATVTLKAMAAACPVCHAPCRMLVCETDPTPPAVGDLSVCGRCGSPAIFELNGKHALSDEEYAVMPPETQAALAEHVAKWTPTGATKQ